MWPAHTHVWSMGWARLGPLFVNSHIKVYVQKKNCNEKITPISSFDDSNNNRETLIKLNSNDRYSNINNTRITNNTKLDEENN